MSNKYILIIGTMNNYHKESQLISFLKQKVPHKEIQILSIMSGNDLYENTSNKIQCYENTTLISSVKEIESLIVNAYFIVGIHSPIIEEIVSYLAGKFGLSIFNKCSDFQYICDESKIYVYKNICGGRVEAEVVLSLSERPVFITLCNVECDCYSSNTDSVSCFYIDYSLIYNQKIKLISDYKSNHQKLELNDTKIVIAGGRGIQEKKDFELLEEIASCLNGAVAASRPAVDEGKASTEQQVGQTGKTIQPDFYFAIGISGAPQHIFGMRNSKTIIAINIDPNAQIFKYADYGIIADCKKIIPKFLQELKNSNNSL